MTRYTIEMNYFATYTAVVDAEDEGAALTKARDMAEEADMKEFTLAGERESRIVHTQGLG